MPTMQMSDFKKKPAENIELDLVGIILASSSTYVAVVISDNKLLVGFEGHSVCS